MMIQFVATCLLLTFGSVSAFAFENRPPNIVLIMADDLGYGGLGCYGQTKVATPNIDQLAANGMRFTQAYAGCCMCAPSRCSLLTGLHTGHARVRANDPRQLLTPSDVTFASLLQKQGYATAGFGKWGLGDDGSVGEPYRHGFDNWVGYLDQADAHFHYPDWIWKDRKKFPLMGNDHKANKRVTYAPDVIHDAAIEFIRNNKSQPFFCYLATTIPHAEMLVPADSLTQYQDQFPETPYVGDRYASNVRPRATYAAMVSRMDRDVGRLVRLVQELGIEQDTLIVFTSDNGPINAGGADPDFFNNGGNLRGWKFSLYEGGIRVPLIATWPGHIMPKTSSEMPLSHDDLFPTFCEMINVPVLIGLDGVSVLPTLLGKPNPNIKKKLYWEYPGRDGLVQAVRVGQYKAIRKNEGAAIELYDLTIDPEEQKDLAMSNPQIANDLVRIMDESRTTP